MGRIMGSYPYITQVSLEATYEVFILYNVCLALIVAIVSFHDIIDKMGDIPLSMRVDQRMSKLWKI